MKGALKMTLHESSAQVDGERIARLEEQVASLRSLLAEMRVEQRAMLETLTRASGGLRVLLALGAIGAGVGALRGLGASIGSWLSQLLQQQQ